MKSHWIHLEIEYSSIQCHESIKSAVLKKKVTDRNIQKYSEIFRNISAVFSSKSILSDKIPFPIHTRSVWLR